MSSTNSATLATPFKIKGVNYSITSACSTSAHCIGNGVEQIQWGKQDIVFAGGGEELDWTLSCLFDAMGAMSSKFNDTPQQASRAYDKDRDGFVIAGGAGVVVLEELERAKARGARIYAEVTGYGATSDGFDMVAPSGEGAVRCMQQAISTIGERRVGYINTHGTSTPVGDQREVAAIQEVSTAFGIIVPFGRVRFFSHRYYQPPNLYIGLSFPSFMSAGLKCGVLMNAQVIIQTMGGIVNRNF